MFAQLLRFFSPKSRLTGSVQPMTILGASAVAEDMNQDKHESKLDSEAEITEKQDEFIEMAVRHAKIFLKEIDSTHYEDYAALQKISLLASVKNLGNLLLIKDRYVQMLQAIFHSETLQNKLGSKVIQNIYDEIVQYLGGQKRSLECKPLNRGKAKTHAYAELQRVTQALELAPQLTQSTISPANNAC